MIDSNANTQPKVVWDWGTAYDFFISLHVLHIPNKFGLRGAWAAGVRSRLPDDDRELLDEYRAFLHWPLNWIHNLPEPRDAEAALYALKQMPPKERLPTLFLHKVWMPEQAAVLEDVIERAKWEPDDLEKLKELQSAKKDFKPPYRLEKMLDFWANTEKIGEGYLKAMQSYYEVFFAEEENRIRPKLEAALERAKKQAAEEPLSDLLEDLFQGLRFVELAEFETLILAPSYWSTPIVIYSDIDKDTRILTFGARPPEDSLVPGETIPGLVLQSLKALSDPTRLRIMRYLVAENLTPAELSRRLRLRAPTVTHHLHNLRLAGLVNYTLEKKNERLYSARIETVTSTYQALKDFLERADAD
ncbi:MAG: helix-turn-helix domain-containing protein [Anaerolineae bacterium]|nr:helix-turn-helix domain-containing protein [Anaerolineae bacterium]